MSLMRVLAGLTVSGVLVPTVWMAPSSIAHPFSAGTALRSVVGSSEPLPACDPASRPRYSLVAPSAVRVGALGGFYVDELGAARRNDPRPSEVLASFQPLNARSPLRARYANQGYSKRLRDFRWKIRFARGEAGGVVSVRYEDDNCMRTMSRVVKAAPRTFVPKLKKPRIGRRVVRVSGRISKRARGPVLLSVSQGPDFGDGTRRRRLVTPRRGHFTMQMAINRDFAHLGSGNYMRVAAVALYPARSGQSWPCDDVQSSGPDDECRHRLKRPPEDYFFYLHTKSAAGIKRSTWLRTR